MRCYSRDWRPRCEKCGFASPSDFRDRFLLLPAFADKRRPSGRAFTCALLTAPNVRRLADVCILLEFVRRSVKFELN
jgi:hypothetical protein